MKTTTKRTKKVAPMTAAERGTLAGTRWIQLDGMVDATEAEVLDEAAHGGPWYDDEADRAAYIAGFLAGVASMVAS